MIGWPDLPDLSAITSRAELDALYQATYPDEQRNARLNRVGQVWAFRGRIEVGDLVIIPLKTASVVAIGRVTGPYEYRTDLGEDVRHTRRVTWLRNDLQRGTIDPDLLFSLGAFMTICQIARNNAEARLRALVEGKIVPPPPAAVSDDTPTDAAVPIDLEVVARDQIREFIGQKFKSYDFTRIVAAILKAQGYVVEVSPARPDGGVDVIAGRGAMGFEGPRLVVQVKSSDQPVDVKVLRELQGVMKSFGAEHGLLVSWGGFRQSVVLESRRMFFEIRRWDADDLVAMLLDNYNRLPADLQADLPLKRIWTLVQEE